MSVLDLGALKNCTVCGEPLVLARRECDAGHPMTADDVLVMHLVLRVESAEAQVEELRDRLKRSLP